MEHHIYKKKELVKGGFLKKLLGQKVKENALIEINNLLAEKELTSITVDEVQNIAGKYKVNLEGEFNNDVLVFYTDYLRSCLDDKYLSDEELTDLKHLKFILGINDKEVDTIHSKLAGEIYKVEVEKAIEDGMLDEDEKQLMEKLQNDLKLPSDVAEKIYEISGQELLKNFMNNALSDEMLSPEEEAELQKIAQNLNAEVKLDSATRANLDKYKLFWQIENDAIPEIEVNIGLPRKEKCYFQTKADWLEHAIEPDVDNNTRSGLRIKIAKGDYWRNIHKQEKTLNEKEWNHIDSGQLYLTNKKIIFKGAKGDKIILLNRITEFEVFVNGLFLEKEKGINPFLNFTSNTDIFAMLLGKAISQLD